jgi:hypothetical protein
VKKVNSFCCIVFLVLTFVSVSVVAEGAQDGFVLVDAVSSKVNGFVITNREKKGFDLVESYVEGQRGSAGQSSPFNLGLGGILALEESANFFKISAPEEHIVAFMQEQKMREGFSNKTDVEFGNYLLEKYGFSSCDLIWHLRLRLKSSRVLMTLEPPVSFVSEEKVESYYNSNPVRTPELFKVEYARLDKNSSLDDSSLIWRSLGDGFMELSKFSESAQEVIAGLVVGDAGVVAISDDEKMGLRIIEKYESELLSLRDRYDAIVFELKTKEGQAKVGRVMERVLGAAVVKDF